MAQVGVQLKGMADLIRAVNRYQGLRPVLEKAVFTEANTVLNESKKIVPVAKNISIIIYFKKYIKVVMCDRI